MRVETLNPNMRVLSMNTVHTADKDFLQVLHKAYSNELNEQLKEKTQQAYCRVQCDIYKRDIIDISKCSEAELDTGRYQIREKDGNVRIYDKQTQESFGWILRYGAKVQVDEKSGKKFLINDFGNGFFMMQYVDEELENGLKEFFELEELPEKELDGFTVQTDTNTGIQYITANGYEWQGGHIIFTDEARMKLNALAEIYMREYSGRLKSYDEALFYASFEVRGLAKRTSDGILMLGRDNITFIGKNEKNDWTIYFESQLWEMVKNIFTSENKGDYGSGSSTETKWKKLIKGFDAAEAKLHESTECTTVTYPSGDKDVPDDVYYTFYTPEGIYCRKQGKSELVWQIPFEDESQYDKIMTFLNGLEDKDNLSFTIHNTFWQDFLSGKLDIGAFREFLSTSERKELSSGFKIAEDGSLHEKETMKYAGYIYGPAFGAHMMRTAEELRKWQESQAEKIGEEWAKTHLSWVEQWNKEHPNLKGVKCIRHSNGRWYTAEEIDKLWDEEMKNLIIF